MKSMSSSIYIHVPFCAKRCAYCSFYSTTAGSTQKENYLKAIKAEAAQRAGETLGKPIGSVYFGGGTPSQLSVKDIGQILDFLRQNYTIEPDAEVTLEANPDDVTPEYCAELYRIGINRVSMGVQSFNDETLSTINRRHSASEAVRAVENLAKSGITNISIDLIYGLPGQSLAQFEEDIATALSLPIKHLSSYALSIEAGTPLHALKAQGKIAEASEEEFLTMYTTLCEKMQAARFLQYEISNFCLQGYESRHNSGYWCGRQYVGFGPGAHSYDGLRTRRSNDCSLQSYNDYWTSTPTAGTPLPYSLENLTNEELYDEKVMTRLRRHEGLGMEELSYREQQYILRTAKPFINCGQLQYDGKRLRLTRKGIFISDAIMAELMWDPKFML